jgi:hypothetical protein
MLGISPELDTLGWWYSVIRDRGTKRGRVLLRGRGETILYFGLDRLPEMEWSYYRNGGLQIGKLRTSPRKVNWQAFRIAVPERYPSGRGLKGWSISLSANHQVQDFQALAEVIERSGTPWVGFQKGTGARYLQKEALLSSMPGVAP